MGRRTRLEHFLILRLAIVMAGFLLVPLWGRSHDPAPLSGRYSFVFGTLAVYLLEAVAALALARMARRHTLFLTLRIAVDLVMGGVLVGATGGVDSVFCPLLLASIVAAGTVLALDGALVCASAATAVLAVACMVPYAGALMAPGAHSWRIVSYLLTYGLAFHGISILSSRLVGGLAQAENLTAEIIENMAQGLVATNSRGKVTALNGEARRLLSIAPQEPVRGRAPAEILTRPGQAPVAARMQRCEEGRWEMLLAHAGGAPRPVLMRSTTLRDRRGRPRGVVVLLEDMTLRRQVEAAGRRIARLEELTEVARGIAHEVRNPLASMCGCAEEIAADPCVAASTRRLTEILRREARRVDAIIDEFMSFARPRALRAERVDVGEILQHVALLLRQRTEGGWPAIATMAPPEPLELVADRDLVIQLLLNLGLNALEAVVPEEGEVLLAARRRLSPLCEGDGRGEAHARGVEISVRDNGCGIPEEDIVKIFAPFCSRKARGTGLGLTVAHRIARMHGGMLSAESRAREGSTFRLWLPEVCRTADAGGEHPPALQVAGSQGETWT